MSEVVTTAQMRAIENAAIASGRVTGADLMERAGKAVVEAVVGKWPAFSGPAEGEALRATVLCGPGNNGGDGFVVARLLAERGWTVRVLLHGEAEELPADARLNHDRWTAMGKVGRLDPQREWFKDDLVVDALFGIGLTRPVNAFAGLLDSIAEGVGNMVSNSISSNIGAICAIDVPSGLCADSGRFLDGGDEGYSHAAADLTVTFRALKPGHLLADGPDMCGEVVVASIGLGWVDRPEPGCAMCSPGGAVKFGGNKFDHGHAVILTGAAGHGGAARLAARAALRAGAGLVTMGCPADAMPELAAPPDALMRRAVAGPEDLRALLRDDRIRAVCLGPGAGIGRAEALLAALLPDGRPCVLDADALTALSRQPAQRLHAACVLTPHMGEFARLFPDLAGKLAAEPESGPAFSRLDAAREAARRTGAVVLLKGPDTVIAAPDGEARINSAFDVPWLATAGAGDVLAGIITGLLARGFRPLDAAATGAWLHTAAARAFGPGLIADDLPDLLPSVFRDLNG